jgi:predicted NAD/FAD-binding protein
MKIAIIGTGISGMVAAYLLSQRPQEHDLSVFEANDYIGGHTHTVAVACNKKTYPVDTGFIVFNDQTYPNFIQLLDRLGVASQPSPMSFSVTCEHTGLEYNGTNLNSLFAQRRNILRPSFLRMIRDILRFNREAPALLHSDSSISLGHYLDTNAYSQPFRDFYLIPIGAAIWSAKPDQMADFSARYFVQFFHNHGLLQVNQRPQWRVISGGSSRYIPALTAPYRDAIRLNAPIRSITRTPDHVALTPQRGETEYFDQIVLATHSDQALSLLADPSDAEREILSAFPYQENTAVLHTDASLLPTRRRAWASWNYHRLSAGQNERFESNKSNKSSQTDRVALTYNMNMLQGLDAPEQFCVTLNRSEAINSQTIIQRMTYHHPVYTPQTLAAQRKWAQVNGVNRTYFCGAYWGYGFHEDGVKSALAVCAQFGRAL